MMLRQLSICVMLLAAAPLAFAHFVFVVPNADAAGARVILSEDLKPDEDVEISLISGVKLLMRDAAGKETPLTLAPGKHALSASIAGGGPRIIHGEVDLGVSQHGKSKPFLLLYHPKTIVGDPFIAKHLGAKDAPAEIVPAGKPGELKFQLLFKGKPLPQADMTVLLPDGRSRKVKTDEAGFSPAFDQQGRFGVWSRAVESIAGERGGKSYDEARHYPTLVVDVTDANHFAPLPHAAASFGAAACDGWMYVYGGHVVATHHYSTQAVSARFFRIQLADGRTWEELPGGPAVQGMNLAACNGKIYRAGGMQPRNKPGDKADNHSLADCARFDPQTRRWEPLPPMPQGRSSHDLVVVDGKLIALGGWNMKGRAGGIQWLEKMDILDLTSEHPAWKSIGQPFQRRAIIAAVNDRKIYVLGGFTEESDPSLRVEIYDVKAGTWSRGPDLPQPVRNGFAPAACALNGRAYASVGDGSLLRLDEKQNRWEKIATTTPRIVHRLIPDGSRILVVGGADKGKVLDLIEAVDVGGMGE